MASIIGRSAVEIIVADQAKIVGGLIANAERNEDGLYRELPKATNRFAPDPKTGIKLPHIEGVNKPVRHPDVHIPLSEWIKWKEWNKP